MGKVLAGFLMLLTLASAASAFDLSKKEIGTITRWKTHNGNTHLQYLGPAGKHYLLEFTRDGSKGAPMKLTLWTDRQGNTVKLKTGAVTITFDPHDCNTTRGKCTYTETHSKYGSRSMVWNAKVSDGLWNYTLHHSKVSKATLLESGKFTIDQYGFYIDRDYQEFDKGQATAKGWSRRIR